MMNTEQPTQGILPILIYTLATLFLCYEMALQVSPNVIVEELMRDLNVDAAGIGVMSGIYFYSYTAMQIPVGLLYDRYSARILTTLAILGCAFGALFFSYTTTAFLAGFGRLLMGVGSAFAFISVLVVADRWFEAKYFALLVGIAQMLAAVGAYGGTEPLALAVASIGWRQTIHLLAWFGIGLAAVLFLIAKEKNKQRERVLEKMPIRESLRLILKNNQTWWCGLYAFCSWAPITAFPSLWGVPFLMKQYPFTSSEAANIVGMIWIGMALFSPVLGWLSDHLQKRRIFMDGCALVGFIATMLIIYVPNLTYSSLVALMFAFGIAASGQIISFASVKDINPAEVTATAIGVNNMAVVAPGMIFQPLVGILLVWFWQGEMLSGMPVYSVVNYQKALSVIPCIFLVGFVVSFFKIKDIRSV